MAIMNQTKHTLGPWVAGKNNLAVNFRFVTDKKGDIVAYCEKPKEEAINNCRLIAAAPDMLNALLMVNSCFAPDDNDITAQKVRAAIAKAVQS